MTKKNEITEEVVEGIYAEHQYKCETIEGYAEAFERLSGLMQKAMDNDDKPSKQARDDINKAMAELAFIEMMGPGLAADDVKVPTDTDGMLKMVEAAKAGDKIAHRSLVLAFVEMIDASKKPPALITAYIIQKVLLPEYERCR
jgi:hypothetical protein